jgi:hypothetical protein
MNAIVNTFAVEVAEIIESAAAANETFEIRPLSTEELIMIGGGQATGLI